LLNSSVTIKALFLAHRLAKVSIVEGPTTGPSGKTFDPMNKVGILMIVVRPLMEVDKARGARAFNVGFSNQ
jgi:hypothetical protein